MSDRVYYLLCSINQRPKIENYCALSARLFSYNKTKFVYIDIRLRSLESILENAYGCI